MIALYHSKTAQWLTCPFIRAFVALTPFLQAQAPTHLLMSTWQHPPPGPTCPGRPAMTEASSRHSQSGMALCESSQHALLPAFSSFNTLSVVTENVFNRVVFRTVVKPKTWKIHGCLVCEFVSARKKRQLNWTWPSVFFLAAATASLMLGWGKKNLSGNLVSLQ